MSVVCIDTNLTVWGIKEYATPGQDYMIGQTKRFISHLVNKGDKIMIPSIVAGEFLLTVPVEFHPMAANLLQQGFIVEPFYLQAAMFFARIWQTKLDDGSIELMKRDGATRNKLRADCMIVAIAAAKGASSIFSHDGDVHKFAKGHIACNHVPDIPEQTNFLETD